MSAHSTLGELAQLPALSILQPWATTILNGKDIENRSWSTKFRGRFLIHAGKSLKEVEAWRNFVEGFIPEDRMQWAKGMRVGQLPVGGIVGVAELVDCVTEHESPWFTGEYGFVLRNVQAVPFVPCRGMLGFFHPKFEVAA